MRGEEYPCLVMSGNMLQRVWIRNLVYMYHSFGLGQLGCNVVSIWNFQNPDMVLESHDRHGSQEKPMRNAKNLLGSNYRVTAKTRIGVGPSGARLDL